MSSARVRLVRHAWAGVRGSWPGSDLDRPLDAGGTRQAEALAGALGGDATGLWTSRARRCRDTLAPLASATGLELHDEPLLLEGADPDAALSWLLDLPDGSVVCSHGDVVRGILAALAAQRVIDAARTGAPKGGWWQLTVADRAVAAAEPHPPPEP